MGQGRFGKAGLAVMLCLWLIGGCGEGTDQSTADNPPGDAPDPGGTAVIALDGDPDVLNSLIRRSAHAGQILSVTQTSLAEMGEDLQWYPDLAESWELAPDGLSVTYFLRRWTWSDGEPLDADDIVSSFNLFMDDRVASPRRGMFADVLRAVAVDAQTVRYEFARPLTDPFNRTFHAILPEHLTRDLDPANVQSWEMNRHPLASGPFRVDSWSAGNDLTLVRNETYPGTAALLDRVVYRFIPETAARVVALETGEVDFVDGLLPQAARQLESNPNIEVVKTATRRYYYLAWNFQRGMFADARTRRALSLALDRDRMIKTLLYGYGQGAIGPIAPAVWNHSRTLTSDPHDPAVARRLLAEAGWSDTDNDGILDRDGQKLAFEILTKQGDPLRESCAVILRENLLTVGVSVTVRSLELATGLDLLNQGHFDAYLGLFNANLYGDPSSVVHSTATDQFNAGRYASARVDSLLAAALGVRDRAVAGPIWEQVQSALQADPPAAYLFCPDRLVGVSTRLQNVRPHVLSPVNNLSQWWIRSEDRKYRSGP